MRCSLVAFPVRLYNATTATGKITLNQLHRKTHRRLKMQMVDPELGATDRTDIVKGYEYDKGKYVIVDEADLEKVRLETTKVIDVVQFVDAEELDPLYLNSPYYVAPDGPVAEEAFRVIREAMASEKKVGIGRIVLSGKEHTLSLQVQGRGFVMTTLRYKNEVRSADAYFEEIKNGKIDKSQLQLAKQLISNMAAPFDSSQFEDRYQDALMEIIKAKIEGTEPVVAEDVEVGKVINLMDALKQSVATAPKKPPAKSVKKKTKKASKKKLA